MTKPLFITGIGTDVGKTVIAAILVEVLQADYWKPVQAGNFSGTDSETVRSLISNTKSVIHPEAYSLKQYSSPHAAAEDEGILINPTNIKIPTTNNRLIIEGAGGLMVPLTHNFFIIDLIKQMGCEVILVGQNYLGSINHTLLSIDALRKHNIPLKGFVMNGAPHKMSEDIIIEYAGMQPLMHISKEREINQEVITKYADALKNIQL